MEAASYAACHVHHNIIRHPAFLSDPEMAIKEGIRTTDERFCSRVRNEEDIRVYTYHHILHL